MGIRFGVCASFDKIPTLIEGGYRPEFEECIYRTRKIIDCFNK